MWQKKVKTLCWRTFLIFYVWPRLRLGKGRGRNPNSTKFARAHVKRIVLKRFLAPEQGLYWNYRGNKAGHFYLGRKTLFCQKEWGRGQPRINKCKVERALTLVPGCRPSIPIAAYAEALWDRHPISSPPCGWVDCVTSPKTFSVRGYLYTWVDLSDRMD